MSEWEVGRKAKIAIRANAFANLLRARGIVLFHSWPRRGESFWKNASHTLEVLAIMPKEEWGKVKGLLREMGWQFGGGDKMIAYFGKGRRMSRVLVLTYYHETGSYSYPLASVDFVWYGNDIMICILAYYWQDGYEDINPVSLEAYSVYRTHAKLLIDELRRAGVSLMTLGE